MVELTFRSMEPFGAEVSGVADPADLSAEQRESLARALAERGVLVLRGLDPTPEQHVELTRVFGEPEIHPMESIRMAGVPEIIELKVDLTDHVRGDDDGDRVIADIAWHADLTYVEQPSRGALLRAVDVPPVGGDTLWIDMAQVHSALPDHLRRRIAGLEVVHSLDDPRVAAHDEMTGASTTEFPPVVHPLVHRHPVSGEPVLNISPAFARGIVGMDDEQSAALLGELAEFATREEFIYRHRWTAGDVVVWDNWRTMHLATGHPKRYRRYMRRTTIHGGTVLEAA